MKMMTSQQESVVDSRPQMRVAGMRSRRRPFVALLSGGAGRGKQSFAVLPWRRNWPEACGPLFASSDSALSMVIGTPPSFARDGSDPREMLCGPLTCR